MKTSPVVFDAPKGSNCAGVAGGDCSDGLLVGAGVGLATLWRCKGDDSGLMEGDVAAHSLQRVCGEAYEGASSKEYMYEDFIGQEYILCGVNRHLNLAVQTARAESYSVRQANNLVIRTPDRWR